jgi:flagellar motor switch protein FliM
MASDSDKPGPSSVLSQSEVEQLLSQVQDQAAPAAARPAPPPGEGRVAAPPPAPAAAAAPKVRPFDFRRSFFLSANELRKLRLSHEEFAATLAARLSIYLRIEFGVKLAELEVTTFQQFAGPLPPVTHLVLFKLEPARGIGVIHLPLRLGVALVDRLLGGPGAAPAEERAFSEIELTLADQAVSVVLQEWCNHWADAATLRPSLLGHEGSGRFLQVATRDALLLVLTLQAAIGECAAPIQIAFPCQMLEPIIQRLHQDAALVANEPPRLPEYRWNPALDAVPIQLRAVLPEVELTARRVTELKIGDVLPLDPQSTQRVRIQLADRARFVGRLGTVSDNRAVEITGTLRG